jgi:2-haloacid dehalogenase
LGLNPPAAVVFDLGNVLIHWDPHPAIAAGMGDDEADRFLTAEDFDFMAWNHVQDEGRTWDEAEAEVEASHPHWARHAASYRAQFEHSLLGAVDDSVAVLRDLHTAGVRLAALTNWSSELFPYARERFEFLTLFEDIVVSGDEGVAKPAREIFTVLQERIGIPLDRCVFVDDKAENVAAAAQAGMDALVFTETGHLRDDLRARGLPV